jgi:hypothetical protein
LFLLLLFYFLLLNFESKGLGGRRERIIAAFANHVRLRI